MKIIIAFFIVLIASAAFAETIYLKSGKSVDGTIKHRSDEKIVVEVMPGLPVTYYMDQIESIDEKAVQSEFKKTMDLYSKDKAFDVKSGIVTYRVEGRYKGKRTLYFDDYGRKLMWLEESQGSLNNKMYHHMYLQKDKIVYIVDLEEKVAYKEPGAGVKDARMQAIKGDMFDELPREVVDEYVSEVDAFSSSGILKKSAVLGTKAILGRACEIVEDGSVKGCLYKGIPLEKESSGGWHKLLAIAFEENVEVPEEKFELPNGLFIVPDDLLEAMQAEQAKTIEREQPVLTAESFKRLTVDSIRPLTSYDGKGVSYTSCYRVRFIGELPHAVSEVNEITFEKAIADTGQDLLREKETHRNPRLSADKKTVTFKADLDVPDKDVKVIKEISGTVEYFVYKGLKDVDLGIVDFKEGSTGTEFGAVITSIREYQKKYEYQFHNDMQELRINVQLEYERVKAVRVYDTSGTLLEAAFHGNSGGPGYTSLSYAVFGKLPDQGRIVIEVPVGFKKYTMPFKITDISLQDRSIK